MENHIITLSPLSSNDIEKELQSIQASARGIEIMKEKLIFRCFRITDVDTRAANILKQTMLSQGAEAAVSAGTVNLSASHTDVIIGATLHQLRNAVARLKEQPWGLKDIAHQIEKEYL
ncbi:dihydropteroate synthase [Anaerovibrio lipolyticus]|uniref:dihydropteroate synthase n=1 Tax=Anaerovibrio lipolyticus TaxID=82374 RepID=UPI0023F07EAF|nr:dihydropteroate synthase [Anaerovibrio lipolyticus]